MDGLVWYQGMDKLWLSQYIAHTRYLVSIALLIVGNP